MILQIEIKKPFMEKKDFINRFCIIEMQNFTIKSIVLEKIEKQSFMDRDKNDDTTPYPQM